MDTQQSVGRANAARPSFESYGGSAAECYERYFVPAIGAPLAADLVEAATLRPGERVLDVACGTGVVARLATERVGPSGSIAGADINPGMLAVARAAAPGTACEWHQAPADALPLPDASFDAVLCQMGLQFFPDNVAALREMHRVLAPGGRILLNVPGPIPEIFAVLAEALERHIKPGLAPFVRQVFSIHEPAVVQKLMTTAGFSDATARSTRKTLALPSAADFLWQYVRSTPLGAAVAEAADTARIALEREVVQRWAPFTAAGRLTLELPVLTGTARTS